MKIKLGIIGYAIGLVVIFPFFLYLGNLLFFSGSKEVNEYAPKYIEECIVDTVEIDKNYESGSKVYTSALARRGKGINSVYSCIFYNEKYQKYFSLMIFWGRITASHREHIICSLDPAIIEVKVNPKQLNDPAYGSKENPVPVFGLDLLNWNNSDDMREIFHADEREIEYSVEQYLKFIISKENLKRLLPDNEK